MLGGMGCEWEGMGGKGEGNGMGMVRQLTGMVR